MIFFVISSKNYRINEKSTLQHLVYRYVIIRCDVYLGIFPFYVYLCRSTLYWPIPMSPKTIYVHSARGHQSVRLRQFVPRIETLHLEGQLCLPF